MTMRNYATVAAAQSPLLLAVVIIAIALVVKLPAIVFLPLNSLPSLQAKTGRRT
jgi:hypothetical protein